MPEGDTLYRAAANVRPVLEGRVVVEATSNPTPGNHAVDAAALVGRVATKVRASGKQLFVFFEGELVVHSHLGMTGSWHVYPQGETWNKPASRAGLTLSTGTHDVVLFSPKLLELVTATAFRRNDYLRRLGPDLMLVESDLAAAVARMRVHNAAPIGEVVMNQTIAAGIGNIYKSETLFLARINPWTRVAELSDERLRTYLEDARTLMRRNRGSGPRVTRFRGDGGHFWVYGRRGEPCYVCGGVVTVRRQGDAGRTTYWCAACQPATGCAPPVDPRRQRGLPPIKGCG
ncbi:MAG: Fpg/Nei family DNA glycosylase [Lacipirellulaceae bacterium]